MKRLKHNPIVTCLLDKSLGDNICGPSLIKVPDWIEQPLGRYYLYFAHHDHGQYIRLAYSDQLHGPWKIYRPGTLHISQTGCVGHIASPDVHVDDRDKSIRMYFHGPVEKDGVDPLDNQRTFVALSKDGLNFFAQPDDLGESYFRVFWWKGDYYALAMPGRLLRSKDGLRKFERGTELFQENMRHSAVYVLGDDRLLVFYSNVGSKCEDILMSTMDLHANWDSWIPSDPISILKPEFEWEGSHLPRRKSTRGSSSHPVNQLRDPAVFSENGLVYLLYTVAGENGIAIGKLEISK